MASQTLGYVLHTRPWRETSLLVDILSQDYGRIACIAKGAKRAHSPLRGILEPFCPLSLAFTGKQGLKNLIAAQWTQAPCPLAPAHSMAGWYMSELCLRSMAEDDPHPAIFAAYDAAIARLLDAGDLADTSKYVQSVLRVFEQQLLKALGFWPDCQQDGAGLAIQTANYYTLDTLDTAGASGWRMATLNNAPWCLVGAQIAALDAGDVGKIALADTLNVRLAMRALLALALPDKMLSTRSVWLELDAMKLDAMKLDTATKQ